MDKVIELTEENFNSEVIEAGVPVLVDFWAPWCAPCRTIAPTMEALASEYDERAKVAKLNVDENRRIAGALGIMSIPTVMVFKAKNVVAKQVGALPKAEYESMIDEALVTAAA